MAIIFPTGPSNNQLYTIGERTWKYNSAQSAWEATGGGVGPTGPTSVSGVNAQTGTSYTLDLSDDGKLVTLTNASAITVEVPSSSTVGWRTGSAIYLMQGGAGQVTVQGASGVTVNRTMLSKTRTQYSTLSLIYVGSNVWLLTGDMAAS